MGFLKEIDGKMFSFRVNLVVKNGNFTLLLTSSGQEWQFCHEIDRKTFIFRVNLGM